jgi:hypothetical protein
MSPVILILHSFSSFLTLNVIVELVGILPLIHHMAFFNDIPLMNE